MPNFYDDFIQEAEANRYTREEADKELIKSIPDTVLGLKKKGFSNIDINRKLVGLGLPSNVWSPPPEAVARPQPSGQIPEEPTIELTEEERRLNDVYSRIKNKKIKAMLLQQNPNIALIQRKIINDKLKSRVKQAMDTGFIPKGAMQAEMEDIGIAKVAGEQLIQAGIEAAKFEGENVLKRADIGTKFILGSVTPEQAIQESQQLVSLPQPEDQTFPERVIRSTAELIPFLRRSARAGGVGFIAGAAAGGLGAPITAPVGAAIGLFGSSMQVEGGNAALDLLQEGVDPDIARTTGIIVGAINGALELVSFKILGRFLSKSPIGRKIRLGTVKAAMKNPATRSALQNASRTILQFTGALAGEVSVEEAQEATNIIGEEISKSINAIRKDEQYQAPEAKEIIDRFLEVGEKAALGFGGILAGGKIITTAAKIPVKTITKAETTQRLIQKISETKIAKKLKEKVTERILKSPKLRDRLVDNILEKEDISAEEIGEEITQAMPPEGVGLAIKEVQPPSVRGIEKARVDAKPKEILAEREPAQTIEQQNEKAKTFQFIEPTKVKKEIQVTDVEPDLTARDRQEIRRLINTGNKKIETRSVKEAKEFVHEMIIQRAGNLSKKKLKSESFNLYSITKKLNKAEREAFIFHRQKTDVPKQLNRPDLEKTLSESKDKLEAVNKNVGEYLDEAFREFERENKDFSDKQIENYVTQLWDIPKNKIKTTTRWFTTRNPFLKKRFIDTYKEGIEKGLKPKTLDISELVNIYDNMRFTVQENKKFLENMKRLRVEGMPIFEVSSKAPMDWESYDHPALRKNVFIPTGKLVEGQQVSPDLRIILRDMGIQIGRRISNSEGITEGLSIFDDKTKTIRLKQFFKNKTLAHEIGHHIDKSTGLGKAFVEKHKNELLELNKERTELLKGTEFEDYANTSQEQIAELFAFMWTEPDVAVAKAPNAMAEALEVLANDNVMKQLIDFDFEKKAKTTVQEQVNIIREVPVKVHPDLKQHLDVVFGDTLDFGIVGNSLGTLNAYMKKSILSLSFFHHYALSETSLGIFGAKTPEIAKRILTDAMKKTPAPLKKQEIAADALEHTLTLGNLIDIPVGRIQQDLRKLANLTKDKAIIGRVTQAAESFNKAWDKALWTYLHDGFKLYAYEHLVSKMPENTKDVTAYKRSVASIVNDTFGGQNWEALLVTPAMRQISSAILLSPDWTLSTIRQALSPISFRTDIPGLRLLGIQPGEIVGVRRRIGSMFWIKAMFYYTMLSNMSNILFRTLDRERNPEKYPPIKFGILDYTMLGNTVGHKTHLFFGRNKDGTERYLRLGKQFRELFEFVYDFAQMPVDSIAKVFLSVPSAAKKRLGVKMSPVTQWASGVMFGKTPSGWDIKGIQDAESWEWAFEVAKHTGQSFLPFSSRRLLRPDVDFLVTDVFAPQSKGMSEFRAKKWIKEGLHRIVEGGNYRFFVESYYGAHRNGHDAFDIAVKSAKSLIRSEGKDIKGSQMSILENEKALKTAKGRDRVIIRKNIRKLQSDISKNENNIKEFGRIVGSLVQNKDNLDLSKIQ
jgi:hypothetical protein